MPTRNLKLPIDLVVLDPIAVPVLNDRPFVPGGLLERYAKSFFAWASLRPPGSIIACLRRLYWILVPRLFAARGGLTG